MVSSYAAQVFAWFETDGISYNVQCGQAKALILCLDLSFPGTKGF